MHRIHWYTSVHWYAHSYTYSSPEYTENTYLCKRTCPLQSSRKAVVEYGVGMRRMNARETLIMFLEMFLALTAIKATKCGNAM